MYTDNNEGEKIVHKRGKKARGTMIILLSISAVLVVASGFLIMNSLSRATKAAFNSYGDAKDTQKDEVYQDFYNKAYENAERKNHVKNETTIDIESLKEEAKLQVLQVSDVEYVIEKKDDNKDGITSWLEVPGYSYFFVDMDAAEYVFDTERAYILIRLPRPELGSVTIDDSKVTPLLWDNSGGNDSIKDGVKLATEQYQEGYSKIKEYFHSNVKLYDSAKRAAESMIRRLVKEFNNEIDNLTIDIEFME